MSAKNPSKNTVLALDTKAIEGVDKYFATATDLLVGGTTYTPASLKAVLQKEIDVLKAIDAARAAVKQQVAGAVAVRASARTARRALRQYIVGSYGAQAVQMLEDFGMSRRPKAKTVEVKAQAIAKGQATREARHTMGSKQKSLIKGAPQPQPATTGSSSQGTAPGNPASNGTPPKP
jgi:hypothetical protein